MKAKSGEIKMDEKFSADDDWIRGLNIRLANHSSRTVTFVGLVLLISITEDQKPGIPAGWPFEYGLDPFDFDEDPGPLPQFDSVLPARDLEIQLSDTEYENLKSFLKELQFPVSIKQLDVRIIKIGFSDGTAWNNGYLFRRDSKNKKGPLKGWVLIEDSLRIEPKARNRQAVSRRISVVSKLKCPVLLASEVSGLVFGCFI